MSRITGLTDNQIRDVVVHAYDVHYELWRQNEAGGTNASYEFAHDMGMTEISTPCAEIAERYLVWQGILE